jgi:hypothetical protein
MSSDEVTKSSASATSSKASAATAAIIDRVANATIAAPMRLHPGGGSPCKIAVAAAPSRSFLRYQLSIAH